MKYIILGLILLLGAFLFLFKLSEIPPGLGVDEAPNGINAYSVLLTGKDEYGKFLPISFKFTGVYPPPLYTYLTIPAVYIFGLDLFSVRIVSAISGLLGILVIFKFLKDINVIQNEKIIYVGTLLFAISPWVIMYARSGYEAMLSYLIYTLGTLFIWNGFKKPIFLTFGSVLLSVSIYASYTNKFLVPLLFIFLFVFFKRYFLEKRNRKYLMAGLLIALVIQIPNLLLIFTKSFFVKSNISFFENVLEQYAEIKEFVPFIIGVPFLFVREFISHYLTYFSIRSLFSDPDPFLARSIPNLSVFYPWLFIPFIVGLRETFKNRAKESYKFLIILAVISPIPAALTKDPFWTYRAIPLLAPLLIIITIGIDRIFKFLNTKVFTIIFSIIFIYSLFILWRGYFLYLPLERAVDWQYGYNQLAGEILTRNETHFVLDNTRMPSLYTQLAFFMKLSPDKLQNSATQELKVDYYNNLNVNPNRKFDNLEIRALEWKTDVYKDQILVGDNLTFSPKQIVEHELTKVFEIKDPLNNVIIEAFQTNPSKKCLNGKILGLPKDPLCN